MRQLANFHEYAITYLIFIFSFITVIIVKIYISSFLSINTVDNEKLELLWTITPCFILILLAVPSLNVLYFLEESFQPQVSLKIIGHQWFWSYEFSDFIFSNKIKLMLNKNFDSYIKNSYVYRLLEVDKCVFLPKLVQIRGLITSEDVLHSWAVPRLGLKIDACPGRINIINIFSLRSGKVYGQCSEICGVNHSFIPVVVNFVELNKFHLWLLHF